MTAPTNPDYLSLINAIQVSGGAATASQVPGWSVLVQPTTDNRTGLVAAAFLNNDTGQVVTVFRGVSTPSGPNDGSTTADETLFDGYQPQDYESAVSLFVTQVRQTAAQDGLSTDSSSMFFTGNSLGGFAAQWAAANIQAPDGGNYGGASFGGPGIPGYAGSAGYVTNFVSYVNAGDPIGNRATDTGIYWGSLGQTNNSGAHFGQVQIIGLQSSQVVLQRYVDVFVDSLTNPYAQDPSSELVAGVAGLGVLISQNHSYSSYANNLGVILSESVPASSPDTPDSLFGPVLYQQILDGVGASLTLGVDSA